MTSIFEFLPPPDVRTKNLFLISSVYTTPVIVATYLLIIHKIGPDIMEKRPPFEFKGILIFYNSLQVFFNASFFLKTIPYWPKTNLFCSSVDQSNEPEMIFLTRMAYFYFGLKFFDLVETIFFVLRKKYNQVSFLHVYHHVGMLNGAWFTVRYYPGGQLLYIGVFNSVVHIVMYSYYLLSIWDPKSSIWWKKYLTQLQIAHQVILFFTMTTPLLLNDCSFPKAPCRVVGMFSAVQIPLFVHFYLKNYVYNQKVSSE